MTDHTFAHARRVEERAVDLLVATGSTKSLHWYEMYLLALSCWLHDSGLVYQNENETIAVVRREHGIRCRKYISEYLGQHLNPFEQDIVTAICRAHLTNDVTHLAAQSSVELKGTHGFVAVRPRVLATIVRLADAADISQARVSWHIAAHFQMNPESMEHWRRHLNIQAVFWDTNSKLAQLTVEGTYGSYEEKAFLDQAVDLLNAELSLAKPHLASADIHVESTCKAILHERDPEQNLRWSVLPRNVYRLLTEGMYDSRTVHIRELIQNSLDAIKVRQQVIGKDFDPVINMTVWTATGTIEDRAIAVRIRDSGIGMDSEDVVQRLIKIGGTIRDSHLLRQIGVDPSLRERLIARFGVGFVTVFAAASRVNVTTKKPGMSPIEVFFEGGEESGQDFCDRDIRIERASGPAEIGTDVVVYYRDDLTGKEVYDALQHYVRGWDQCETQINRAVQKWNGTAKVDEAGFQPFERTEDLLVRQLDLDVETNAKGLSVLQEGILVEDHAADLLPIELRNFITGVINLPAGKLNLVSSRNAFRRDKSTLSRIRRRIEPELFRLQRELLEKEKRFFINARHDSPTEKSVRAFLDWSFSSKRTNSSIKRRERDILHFLAWEGVGRSRENLGLGELMGIIEQKNCEVRLVAGRGWVSLKPVARLSNVTLYASTSLPYLSALNLVGQNTLLLEADQLEAEDAGLCGEQVMRGILKRRGKTLVVHKQHKGLSEFASDDPVASRGIRLLYDVMGDEAWLHALDVDDFVIMDERDGKVVPIVNVNSKKIAGTLRALGESSPGDLRKLLGKAIILLCAMKFNESIDAMMEALKQIDLDSDCSE